MKFKIGVDLMGSDNAPSVLLDVLQSLSLPKDISLLGIATREWVRDSFEFQCAEEFISMDENPLTALRKKKRASLCVGMRLLKEGKIDAFVSAGNTGALVTAGKMIVGTIAGVLRPALCALMPTKKNPVAVLDVGANVQVKARHLVQFAMMGAAYQKSREIKKPVVGMLNIGSEAGKGGSELKIAYRALEEMKEAPFRFAGNIEGNSVFDGKVDVLITDGFTGNVFLKTAEGLANLILERLRTHIPSDMLLPQLSDLQRHLHYAEYPGALMAGLNGIAIKCHGYSTPEAFANAVKGAVELVQQNFLQNFKKQSQCSISKFLGAISNVKASSNRRPQGFAS